MTNLSIAPSKPFSSTLKSAARRSCVVLAGAAPLAFGNAHAQGTPAAETALKGKVAMCIGCHNIPDYKATFPELHRVPMIAGQSAKYIAAALTAYRKGERKHPTMRGIAAPLSDQDINDIAAYYEKLGGGNPAPEQPKPAPADVAALLAKGACVSCHGANFSKPIDGYPKVAGQYADYLYIALKSYQTDANPNIGRGNPIMAGQARQFSKAELKKMADYLGSLQGEMSVVPQSRFK